MKNNKSQLFAMLLTLKRALIGLLMVLTGLTLAFGQQRQPSRGLQFANSYASNGLDAVNVSNGNVVINLPIASLPTGRGTSPGYTVTLQYNSKLWDSRQHIYTDTIQPGNQDQPPEPTYNYTTNILELSDRGGWKMLSGYRLIETDRLNLEDPNPCVLGHDVKKLSARWKMEVEFPDGSVRQFIPTYHAGVSFEGYFSVRSNGRQYSSATHTHPGNGLCYTVLSEGQATTSGMHYITTDGSRLRLFVPYQNSNWKIYSPDGTVVENAPPDDTAVAQRITERNGGKVEIRGTQIVDDLGRSITITSTGVTVKGIGGEDVTTQIVGGTRWVRRGYLATGHNPDEIIPAGTNRNAVLDQPISTIEQIILPSQLGGQSYVFDYYADTTQPPVTSSGWGELKSVTLPSGAKATYSYDEGGSFASNVLESKVNTRTLTYTESYDDVNTVRTETTSYTSFNGSSSFTNPDGTGTSESAFYYTAGPQWDSGLTYSSVDSGGAKTERIWKQNLPFYTGTPYAVIVPGNGNAYVKTEFSTIPNTAGQPALTGIKDYKYDKNGNVTRIVEYDWVPAGDIPRSNGQPTGVPATAQIKRITVNEYYNQAPDAESSTSNGFSYENAGGPKLKNVIKSTEIREKQGATEVPVARTEYFYDDPNDKGNLIETRVWDNTKGGLDSPNTAGSKLYSNNHISTTTVYDPHGNPTLTTDGEGNQTQIIYGPINGPSQTYSGLYPTEVKAAFNTAIQQTSQTEYDFYTGQPKKVTVLGNTAAENVVSEAVYDAVGRPKITKAAVGTPEEAWTRTDYFDAERRVVTKSDLFAKDDGKKVSIQHYDQLGRVRLSRTLEDATTQNPADETHGIKVQTRYRAAAPNSYTVTSNPYRATYSDTETAPTMGWTRSKSWSHGRRTEVETFAGLPAPWGTNEISSGVSIEEEDANATVTTDEAGKKRRTLTDGLGRLTRVDEPDANGVLGSLTSPYQPTVYSYDTLGNLLQIQQTGSVLPQCITTTTCSQTRSFAYSTLSRLTQSTNPESGTFQYTYDDNGNLLTKTDARNISTTYTYDALNRVTFRDYSDSTPDITYTYDDTQIARSKGKLTKIASSVSETRYTGFDAQDRITQSNQVIEGQTYPFAYTYNLDDSLKTQTYPSGKMVTFGYDSGGDLASVSGQTGQIQKVYANQFSYTAHGQVEKMRLGNGRWETTQFTYSRQIKQIGLGYSPGNTGLWKVNYEYGELQTNGDVDAVKNNGNLAKQTITVPTIAAVTGFTAVQGYGYDSLDRLKSAVETVGGVEKWKQTFKYDRFGNKTFDVANTTILSSESSVPTVANPEVLPNSNKYKEDQDGDSQPDYLYDASGNVTKNARQQNFTYDAENRQVTAVGTGLSTSYSYDGNGKRVKSHNSINGQTTIFVYDSDGDLAAEYTVNVPAPPTPTINYLTEDALGSVRVTTNSFGEVKARRDFLPFGEEIFSGIGERNTNQKYSSNADDTRKKFATYQRDSETGLDFAQSRYFSPMHGRFTSPDEFKGGPDELFDFEENASGNPTFYADLVNPQSLSKYQYSFNNPYKFNDPSGHCPFCEAYNKAKERVNTALDVAQTVISGVGLVPAVGEIADGVNAVISTARGNYGEAALDVAGMAGPVGSGVAIGNRVRKIVKAVSKADDAVDLVKPTARGLTNEAKVLKSEKLTKNTKKVSSKEGNSIPDGVTKKNIAEIKDTKRVTNTKQIRIQRQAAIDSKRRHTIITGKNTKVSRNVEQPPTRVKRRNDLGPQ